MRLVHLVTYDICDPKRLRRVYETMRAFGEHLQLSVFLCELTESEKLRMLTKLESIVKHDEDQVLIVYLGPAGGTRAENFTTVGRPFVRKERGPTVI